MKDIEILVQEAIKYIECENTRDANISLVNLYRTVQSNPSCLQSVNDYAIIGKDLHSCYVINYQMILIHYKQYPV